MLGDSITEQGPWPDLLPELSVVNRGYSGFTTEQLVDIADEVAPRCPQLVFVLAGTNDIRDSRAPEWTSTNLAEILDRFGSCSPATQVVMHTIPPRADAVTRVAATNEAIKELASVGWLLGLVSACQKQSSASGAFEDVRGECIGVDAPLRPVAELGDQSVECSALCTAEHDVSDGGSLECIGRCFDLIAHCPPSVGQLVTVEPTA